MLKSTTVLTMGSYLRSHICRRFTSNWVQLLNLKESIAFLGLILIIKVINVATTGLHVQRERTFMCFTGCECSTVSQFPMPRTQLQWNAVTLSHLTYTLQSDFVLIRAAEFWVAERPDHATEVHKKHRHYQDHQGVRLDHGFCNKTWHFRHFQRANVVEVNSPSGWY